MFNSYSANPNYPREKHDLEIHRHDMIDGYYSAALFESIAKYVGKDEVDDTILFWRAKTPAVYLGYHQYVEDEIHEDYCAANGIQVVRRVLGGGCGFCDEKQILFSVIASGAAARFPQTSGEHIHVSLAG